ncbi:MAG: glycosyltransferase family 4 protein [Candidatus Krumholzibacteriia bacterium]
MRLMVLTPYLPHRRVGHGGGTAVRDLVTWLARRHEVRLVSLVRPGERDLVSEVEALGASVAALPFSDAGARGLDRLQLAAGRAVSRVRSLASGYPHYVEKYWSASLSRRVLAAVAEFQPDAVQVEYLQLALFCRDLFRDRERTGRPGPRLILNSHELGSVPRERRAAAASSGFRRRLALAEAARWRGLQIDATTWADRTLCVTPEDHRLYAAMGGRNLVTMPLGMDCEAIVPEWDPGDPETFLFVGSFGHRPNTLAAAFLVDTVWPRVAAARPHARLVLAGRGSRSFLAAHRPGCDWNARGIEAVGFVDDLAPLFRACRLFVAPLPEGGGIKIKILEAMARGVPVVTSPVGAEGIAHGDDLLVISPCDAGFAEAVLAAAADPEGCRNRARAARLHIEREFSWESITDRLARLYAGLPPRSA